MNLHDFVGGHCIKCGVRFPHQGYDKGDCPGRDPYAEIRKGKQMHYRNGREAKNGDKIIMLDSEGKVLSYGLLYNAQAGNDYCNGAIAPINIQNACIVDCLHIDDLAVLLAEKGLDKRPSGK